MIRITNPSRDDLEHPGSCADVFVVLLFAAVTIGAIVEWLGHWSPNRAATRGGPSGSPADAGQFSPSSCPSSRPVAAEGQ
jgi:hypothetical protein